MVFSLSIAVVGISLAVNFVDEHNVEQVEFYSTLRGNEYEQDRRCVCTKWRLSYLSRHRNTVYIII